jgi:protein-disulfide isomerase
MRKETVFFGVVAVAVVGGYIGGRALRHDNPEGETAPTAARPGAPSPTAAAPGAPAPAGPVVPNVGNEVYRVELGEAPVRGATPPKVTLVEYSDFECPYCGRMTNTVDKLLKDYPNDLAVSFKHFPLPPQMHPHALPAALAAEAAREQGKFWPMHDKLFANQRALQPADLEKYAQEIGLDMPRFKTALEQQKGKEVIEAQQKEGGRFGVRGTPASFINGRFMSGAQQYGAFKAVIDEEIKKADARIAGGASRGALYANIIKGGLERAVAPPPPAAAPARRGEPEAGVAYQVAVGKAPVKGAKDALVTIVQFSDFQCPFCSKVEPTIAQVLDAYKDKVRVAWKDNPLSFHPNAMPAAIAARAAGEQGRFWDMHGKLFANQQTLSRATYEKLAEELHLDMPRFRAALDGEKHKAEVQADQALAAKMGAGGTPAFFVNGVFLSGAQPFDMFKSRIDEEMKKAEALVAKGTPRAKVYDAIMKTAKADLPAAAAPGQPQAGAEPSSPEQDTKVWKVEPGDGPSRGPKNAPVTLVVFSDFQCPFCKRVEPSITQIEKEYPNKIRVVWKNMPLAMHQNAKPAAAASLAAGEQGKFWEMHDKLFENQTALDRPSLDKYAQELGLDVARFRAALDTNKFGPKIDADMKEAAAVDVNGTPATFVNGRKIPGAYPYDTFKKMVDQELSKRGPVAARRRG